MQKQILCGTHVTLAKKRHHSALADRYVHHGEMYDNPNKLCSNAENLNVPDDCHEAAIDS